MAIFGMFWSILKKELLTFDEKLTIMEGKMNNNEGVSASNEVLLLRYFRLSGLGDVAFG